MFLLAKSENLSYGDVFAVLLGRSCGVFVGRGQRGRRIGREFACANCPIPGGLIRLGTRTYPNALNSAICSGVRTILPPFFEVVNGDHIGVVAVEMREGVGVFNAASGTDVFACYARGIVSEVFAAGVNLRSEIPHDIGVLFAYVIGFADVGFEIVEFPNFLIVFADVEFPFAAPHGFDAVAFVVKEGFVLRCRAFFCEHERADVFAVDDAVSGHFCTAKGRKRGVKVHGRVSVRGTLRPRGFCRAIA